jgi:hypothetical protein
MQLNSHDMRKQHEYVFYWNDDFESVIEDNSQTSETAAAPETIKQIPCCPCMYFHCAEIVKSPY